jgi:hypothetical protein
MKIQAFAILAAGLLLTGCRHTYQLTPASRTTALRPEASALVALPEDGRFQDNLYAGSGRKTALAVNGAFAKHLRRVDITREIQPLAEQLSQARAGNFDYLIVPALVHWEDRATEWSGIPDRIEIELRTVDAASGETLALGSVKGQSKLMTLTGDAPEELLTAPLKAYVDWLFSPTNTPPPNAVKAKQ